MKVTAKSLGVIGLLGGAINTMWLFLARFYEPQAATPALGDFLAGATIGGMQAMMTVGFATVLFFLEPLSAIHDAASLASPAPW